MIYFVQEACSRTSKPAERIYINEDLVDSALKFMGATHVELRSKTIQGAWFSNCRIMVKTTSGSTIILQSINQLKQVVKTARRS